MKSGGTLVLGALLLGIVGILRMYPCPRAADAGIWGKPSRLKGVRQNVEASPISKTPVLGTQGVSTSIVRWNSDRKADGKPPTMEDSGEHFVPPEIRRMYEEYRNALALQDLRAQDEVYPALCARRGEAIECAREALRAAKTAADRAIAEKCLRFLEIPPPPGRHYHGRSGS